MSDFVELPDDLRIPLYSLQADIRQMFGRVAADSSVASMMTDAAHERLSQIETAVRGLINDPVRQLGGAPDDLHNLIKVTFADMTIERMNEVCKQVLAMRKPVETAA